MDEDMMVDEMNNILANIEPTVINGLANGCRDQCL